MVRRKMLAVLALLLCAGWLVAAEKPIVGTWEVTSDSPDGEQMRWTLVVKEEGGKLAGNISGGMGQFALVDPQLVGNTFTFKITVDAQTYAVETKVTGSKLQGSWKGGSAQGVLKGTKQS